MRGVQCGFSSQMRMGKKHQLPLRIIEDLHAAKIEPSPDHTKMMNKSCLNSQKTYEIYIYNII